MSDKYVRDLCAEWAALVGVPFYNTINEEQDPTDPEWFTLEYQVINKQRDTFCSYLESGLVSLIFFGQAGVGYEDLLQIGQEATDIFVANVDPTGRLTLELSQPPSDYTGLNSPSYIVEFAVNYTFR